MHFTLDHYKQLHEIYEYCLKNILLIIYHLKNNLQIKDILHENLHLKLNFHDI